MSEQNRTALRVLVVMPAYNEGGTIGGVLTKLKVCAPDYEIVVVNDASTDNTGAVVDSLGVRQILQPEQSGYGRALQTGMLYGIRRGFDVIVFMDADGQHDPTEARGLVDCLVRENAGVVIGSRFMGRYCEDDSSAGRRIGMSLFSWATLLLTGRRIYDTTCGYKALKNKACRGLVNIRFLDFHAEALVYLLHAGFVVKEYPVTVSRRTQGRSMYSAISYLKYPLRTLPLMFLALASAHLPQRDLPAQAAARTIR